MCLIQIEILQMRQLWQNWAGGPDAQITPAGNYRAPSFALFGQWVLTAWNDLPEDIVR